MTDQLIAPKPRPATEAEAKRFEELDQSPDVTRGDNVIDYQKPNPACSYRYLMTKGELGTHYQQGDLTFRLEETFKESCPSNVFTLTVETSKWLDSVAQKIEFSLEGEQNPISPHLVVGDFDQDGDEDIGFKSESEKQVYILESFANDTPEIYEKLKLPQINQKMEACLEDKKTCAACDPPTTNKPVMPSLEKMEHLVLESTIDGAIIQQWFASFIELTQASRCEMEDTYFPPAAELAESFSKQMLYLKGKQNRTEYDNELLKYVAITYQSLQFYFDSVPIEGEWPNPNKSDDISTLTAYHQLKNLIWSDGILNEKEKLMLTSLRSIFPEYSTTRSILDFLQNNQADPDQHHYFFSNGKTEIVGFENQGNRLDLSPYSSAENGRIGYHSLDKNAASVKGHVTEAECFTFALADPNECLGVLTQLDDLWKFVNQYYQPINPLEQRAQNGDLVVYWNYGTDQGELDPGVPHMALVSQVDSHGKPTHVIGKFGFEGKIYEHPIDAAPAMYGQFYSIFRKN